MAQCWLLVFSAGDQTGLMLLEENEEVKKENAEQGNGKG